MFGNSDLITYLWRKLIQKLNAIWTNLNTVNDVGTVVTLDINDRVTNIESVLGSVLNNGGFSERLSNLEDNTEKTLLDLAADVESCKNRLANGGQFDVMTANTTNLTSVPCIGTDPMIITSTYSTPKNSDGTISLIPAFVGQECLCTYVDNGVTRRNVYKAFGTSSTNDWILIASVTNS